MFRWGPVDILTIPLSISQLAETYWFLKIHSYIHLLKIWNNIPVVLREAQLLESFKSSYILWFLLWIHNVHYMNLPVFKYFTGLPTNHYQFFEDHVENKFKLLLLLVVVVVVVVVVAVVAVVVVTAAAAVIVVVVVVVVIVVVVVEFINDS